MQLLETRPTPAFNATLGVHKQPTAYMPIYDTEAKLAAAYTQPSGRGHKPAVHTQLSATRLTPIVYIYLSGIERTSAAYLQPSGTRPTFAAYT